MKPLVQGWRYDYGWLVVLYANERRHWRHLPPGTTHRQAQAVMRAALEDDPTLEKAWLIRKDTR